MEGAERSDYSSSRVSTKSARGSDPNRLTGRQAQALMFIQTFFSERGYSPTVREIADHLGLTPGPSGTVTDPKDGALVKLAAKGWITKPGGYVGRGYAPTILGWATVQGREVPVFPVTL